MYKQYLLMNTHIRSHSPCRDARRRHFAWRRAPRSVVASASGPPTLRPVWSSLGFVTGHLEVSLRLHTISVCFCYKIKSFKSRYNMYICILFQLI